MSKKGNLSCVLIAVMIIHQWYFINDIIILPLILLLDPCSEVTQPQGQDDHSHHPDTCCCWHHHLSRSRSYLCFWHWCESSVIKLESRVLLWVWFITSLWFTFPTSPIPSDGPDSAVVPTDQSCLHPVTASAQGLQLEQDLKEHYSDLSRQVVCLWQWWHLRHYQGVSHFYYQCYLHYWGLDLVPQLLGY